MGTATGGLRERKKLAAMRRIQEVALDLFDEFGYDDVTVEEIAARADVSPSSVYRYFGTKERILTWDEYDPPFLQALSRELRHHAPVEALRRAFGSTMAEVFDRDERRVQRRARYLFEVPAVWATSQAEMEAMRDLFTGVLADSTGRDPDDLAVQLIVSNLFATFMTAIRHWYDHGQKVNLQDHLEEAFAVVESGLRLPSAPSGK